MDVTIDINKFRKCYNNVIKYTSKSSINPAFSNVYLEARSDDAVYMTGTDGYMSKSCSIIDCDISAKGSVLLPPIIAKIIKSVTGSSVNISTDDTNLFVTSSDNNRTWRFNLEEGDVTIPYYLDGSARLIPLYTNVREAIAEVIPSISGDKVSQQLRYVEVSDSMIRAYGGPSFRVMTGDFFDSPTHILIPFGAAKDVVSSGREHYTDLGILDEHIMFVTEDGLEYMFVKKNGQMYPDLDKFVLEPKDSGLPVLDVDIDELSQAIQAVKPITDDSYVELDIRANRVHLTTVDKFNQTGEAYVDCRWGASPRVIGCDLTLLDSFLRRRDLTITIGNDTKDRQGLIYFNSADETFCGHMELMRSDLMRWVRGG
jgi:DNA polymerase III sliding clamp (beta) subunit (PCNA family)